MISKLDTRRLEAFGAALAETIKGAVAGAMTPVLQRLADVESKLAANAVFQFDEKLEGIEAEVKGLRDMIAQTGAALEERIAARAAELGEIKTALEPLAGRIAEIEEIEIGDRLDLLDGALKAVGEIVQTSGVELEKAVEAQGAALAGIVEGQGALEAGLIALVKASVEESVAGIETIKGDKGDTGASVVSAMINRAGSLILTCADGSLRDVGLVVGKDGDDGEPGLGFDDLDVELVGDRTLAFVWQRGDLKKSVEFVIPWVLDRGVYVEGEKYVKGDGVTFGGALWIAQKDTGSKPGGDDTWRLAVKKGRDGRDLREGGK